MTSGSGLCRPPGPKSPGSKKSKFITPIDPSRVSTSGWKVKNCTGYCYRGIFIMDSMGSYVPNTSRRVLGILFFFWGGKPLPRSCREFFFPRFSVIFFDIFFKDFLFVGSFAIFRHRTLCPEDQQKKNC